MRIDIISCVPGLMDQPTFAQHFKKRAQEKKLLEVVIA